MKKFANNLLTIVCCSVCLTSCADFLNTEQIGKSTIESFFSEIGGISAAGEGMHHEILKFYGGPFLTYGDIMGNTLNIDAVNADEGEYALFNYAIRADHTSSYPRQVWKQGYAIMTAANNILYYAPQFLEDCTIQKDIETANKVIAQALFARALATFDLCLCYGQPYSYTADASHPGVPVVTRVPGFDDEIPRNTVNECYTQVIKDLEDALEIFGEENSVKDCYHISGIACEALLARVYLYMGNWDKAEEYSSLVMKKVPLSPRDEYVDMYRNPSANPGAESIFRLNSYDCSNSMLSTYDPTSSRDFYPVPEMNSYYEEGDVRAELLTYVGEECETNYSGKVFTAVCKYLPYKSIQDEKYRYPYNFVLRGSEMYLIHAEAICKGSKHDLSAAADDILSLRARALGVSKDNLSMIFSSQQDMENIIEMERIRELCYEGHSLFDITRLGKDLERTDSSNSSVKKVAYPNDKFILPIDQIEMEVNDAMVQNEGYTIK